MSASTSTYTDSYYLLSDLCRELAGDDRLVRVVGYPGSVAVDLTADANGYFGQVAADDPVLIAHRIRERLAQRQQHSYRPLSRTCHDLDLPAPEFLSAERLAAKIRARRPLTAEELLDDPNFRILARRAAQAGKTFSSELLEWEKKATVQQAVAVLRAEVEAERAEQQRLAAEQWERERPAREAILSAYEECGYREAKQGHTVRVEMLGTAAVAKPHAASGTSKGEQYSSRCTYRKTESWHTLYVRIDWHRAIRDTGFATFDGELVLDAVRHGWLADGREVYTLVAVRQGRGTSLETHDVSVCGSAEQGWTALPKRAKVLATEADLAEALGLDRSTPLPVIRDYLADGMPATA